MQHSNIKQTWKCPIPTADNYRCAYKQSYCVKFIYFDYFSDVEEALLILPFSSVCEVLQTLPALIARGDHTELVCKISIFLLKLHHAPIVANHTLLFTLQKLQKLAAEKVQELRVSNFLYFFNIYLNKCKIIHGVLLNGI